MKRSLPLLSLLSMLLLSPLAQAQQYTHGALRLGLISGINLGGEEATDKYADYTPHPYGMFSLEFYAVDRLALVGSLYAGTLSADFRGRELFPEFGQQRITGYDTKYYGLSGGVDYAFPRLFGLTPMGRARIGSMFHHTRVIGVNGFEQRRTSNAIIWSLGAAMEYPLNPVINLILSYDLILTNSDEIDGLRSGKRNDALSLLTVGINLLLRPGDVPPPRSRVYATRSARITPEPARVESGDATGTQRRTAIEDERHMTEEERRRRGVGVTPGDAYGFREAGLALQPEPPPPAVVEKDAAEDQPLQLFTQLSLIPIRRLRDLEDHPELFTLNVWQTGDDEMILKSYVEILRDGRNIYQGNADLLLDGPKDTYRANEFLDLGELLLRNQGDALLPRGNYVVRISTVAWDHELSSLSQAKFLNVDLRPIFGERADTARTVIVKRAVDVTAEGKDALVVNFFSAGQEAVEREVRQEEGRRRPARHREPLPLAPITSVGVTREKLLDAHVQHAFTEALQLQNIADAGDGSEHLKTIVAEVYFPIDDDQLIDESRILLNSVARQINQHPELFAEIRGYANDIGDATANRALANRRARRVLEYLVRQKIDAYRLSVGDTDEEQLMTAPNRDPRLGRKVEIILKNRGM